MNKKWPVIIRVLEFKIKSLEKKKESKYAEGLVLFISGSSELLGN